MTINGSLDVLRTMVALEIHGPSTMGHVATGEHILQHPQVHPDLLDVGDDQPSAVNDAC